MKPSNKNGFTLVEAIVTGVIIAIVAIAATVAYTGFINNSRRQTVTSLAETAAAAANAYVRRTGSDDGLDSAALNLYLPEPGRYGLFICPEYNWLEITDLPYGITIRRDY